MIFTMMPMAAHATTHEHDDTCGYSAASECTHNHDGTCGYAEAVAGAACNHTHGDCSYIAASNGTPCGHSHDANCGYVEAKPCSFTPCDHSTCGYVAESPCSRASCDHSSCGYDENNPDSYCPNLGCDHQPQDNCGYVEGVECPNAGQTCDHSTCGYTEGSPCKHTEHTDCGYSAPVEGVACDHSHDANCGYVEAVEEKPCTHEHNDTCGYSEGSPCTYVEPEHTCDWGDWISNGNGTHTHTCTTDASHTETADCSAYSYAMVDEQNHNILCECLDGENLFVLGTESHTMSDWYSDGDGERRECTAGCDYFETRSIDTHTHSYTTVVTAPTCNDQGYTTYTCSCGYNYEDDYVNALGHNWTDWKSNGNGMHSKTCKNGCGGHHLTDCHDADEDGYCNDCGTEFHKHVYAPATCAAPMTCSCGRTTGIKDPANHVGETTFKPSEHNPGKYHVECCSGCGEVTDSVNPGAHTYAVKYDANHHWEVCTICEYATAKESHVYSDASDTSCNDCDHVRHIHSYSTATCTTPATCSCGATTGSKDPSNHTGGTEIRNAKEATRTEKGYTGDTYCLGCDSMIASGEEIPATGFVAVKIEDDANVKEVTFITAEGVELPDDAAVIVEDHMPSGDDLDFVALEEAPALNVVETLSDVAVLPHEFGDGTLYGPDGKEYTFYEKLIINGEEYYVNGSHADGRLLLFDKNGDAYWYDGNSLGQTDIVNKVIVPDNEYIRINGVVYQICFKSSVKYALWLDGKPVGQYDLMSKRFWYFNEEYTPDKVKEKQQYSNYLGTVTTGETPIDGLESGKTYNVSVIGANGISMKNATAVSGTITQTFDVPAEFVGNMYVTYVAYHGLVEGYELGKTFLSEDGKTVTATYMVDSFSPFIVYAFVEADEPEIKTLSATIVDGSEDVTEPVVSADPVPKGGGYAWLWIVVAILAAGAAVTIVIYTKKKKK